MSDKIQKKYEKYGKGFTCQKSNYERIMDKIENRKNSGRVMEKVGSNIEKENVTKIDVSFIIIDNKPHLNNIEVKHYLTLFFRLPHFIG